VKRTTVLIVDLNLVPSAAPTERADAARNRRKVLGAAEELFAMRSDSESVPRGDEEMWRRFTASSLKSRTAVRFNIRTEVRLRQG
jgi:hypothetical protein